MKKAYWIVAYCSIPDPSVLKEYGKLAVPAIEAGGGKALVRSSDVHPRESGIKERIVVMEFESLEKAVSTYDSPAYQEALRVLGTEVKRDLRIVEGV